jgi:RNA polymerase sigma factor (sigma-70 family)
MALMDDVDAGARWAPAFRALGDERLARMVEGGSDPAFSAIYGRYAPVLHGYCRSLLHDEEEAGDALQNAMLKALQAMRRAGRTGPLRPWLFRIAHNESVTIIRQRSRRPGELTENVVAGQADAFRHAAAREELAELLRDLDGLTDHQRGALVMRELGGLSYDEIAAALDSTPLAARQAVFTAKRKLDPEGKFSKRRLKLLLPPAPAGVALFGLLGGAGGGAVAAAAAVSLGVGTVEIAEHAQPSKPKQRTAVAATDTKKAPKSAPKAAKRTVAPVATATAEPVKRVKARAAAATPPAKLVTASYETASTRAKTQTTTIEAVSTPTPDPVPRATPEPDPRPRPDDHHGDGHQPRPQPTPAPEQPAPQTAPQQAPPPVQQHHGERPQGQVAGVYQQAPQDGRGGRDCPPRAEEPVADAVSEPAPSVAPVQ